MVTDAERAELAAQARAFLDRVASGPKDDGDDVGTEWRQFLTDLVAAGVQPIEEAALNGVRFDALVQREGQRPLGIEFKRSLGLDAGTVAASTGAARQMSVATGADVAYVVASLHQSDAILGMYAPGDVAQLLRYRDPLNAAWSKSGPAVVAPKRESPRIFAAMPFDVMFTDVFLRAIVPAAESVGASAKPRIDADSYFYNDEAISEIKRQIRSSALVVADLTGSRPNVLYECGFADGVGIPVIHVTSDRLKRLPFDLQGRPTIHYVRGAIDTLAPKLRERVAAAFSDASRARTTS